VISVTEGIFRIVKTQGIGGHLQLTAHRRGDPGGLFAVAQGHGRAWKRALQGAGGREGEKNSMLMRQQLAPLAQCRSQLFRLKNLPVADNACRQRELPPAAQPPP